MPSNTTSVIIPSGVTSIGDGTFWGCSSLTEIEIPEGVTSIGDYAFYYCSSITQINLPAEVTSIGSSAFWGCSSLTEINLPEGVTSIGREAFRDCTSLTEINLPAGVTSIGSSAFWGCSSLTQIEIPKKYHSAKERRRLGIDYKVSCIKPSAKIEVKSGATLTERIIGVAKRYISPKRVNTDVGETKKVDDGLSKVFANGAGGQLSGPTSIEESQGADSEPSKVCVNNTTSSKDPTNHGSSLAGVEESKESEDSTNSVAGGHVNGSAGAESVGSCVSLVQLTGIEPALLGWTSNTAKKLKEKDNLKKYLEAAEDVIKISFQQVYHKNAGVLTHKATSGVLSAVVATADFGGSWC